MRRKFTLSKFQQEVYDMFVNERLTYMEASKRTGKTRDNLCSAVAQCRLKGFDVPVIARSYKKRNPNQKEETFRPKARCEKCLTPITERSDCQHGKCVARDPGHLYHDGGLQRLAALFVAVDNS